MARTSSVRLVIPAAYPSVRQGVPESGRQYEGSYFLEVLGASAGAAASWVFCLASLIFSLWRCLTSATRLRLFIILSRIPALVRSIHLWCLRDRAKLNACVSESSKA